MEKQHVYTDNPTTPSESALEFREALQELLDICKIAVPALEAILKSLE